MTGDREEYGGGGRRIPNTGSRGRGGTATTTRQNRTGPDGGDSTGAAKGATNGESVAN